MPHNFLLWTGHFEYYNATTLEVRFSPLPKVCCCCLLWVVVLFSDFSKRFSWRLYSLLCVFTAVSRTFRAETKQNSRSLQMGSACVLVRVFHAQSGNSALAVTSCLHGAWRSVEDKNFGSSQTFFWTFFQPWACTRSSRFPSICRSFSKPLFPKTSHSPAFPPGFLECLSFVSSDYFSPRQQWVIHLPLDVFDQCPP